MGNYLQDKVQKTINPVDYLLSLFVLNNILPAVKNFSYDRGDMMKMIKKVNKQMGAGGQANWRTLLDRHLAENFLSFESMITEILNELLGKENKHSALVFPYVIETVAIYGNNIPQYESALPLKTSKQRVIVHILDSEKMLTDLSTSESVDIQRRIVEGLYGITGSNDRKIGVEVKEQLVSFLYKILVRIEQNSGEPGLSPTTAKDQSMVDLERSAFGILTNIIRNDFYFFDVDFYDTVRFDYPNGPKEIQRRRLATLAAAKQLHR